MNLHIVGAHADTVIVKPLNPTNYKLNDYELVFNIKFTVKIFIFFL